MKTQKDSICLRAFSTPRDSISLKAFSKPDRQEEKTEISIELTDAILLKEAEMAMEGDSIWPRGVIVSSNGRIRNIEAEAEIIEELIVFSEMNGMKWE